MDNIVSTLFKDFLFGDKVVKGMEYLPNEIILKILKNLNFNELFKLKQTCRYFNEFITKYNLDRKRFDMLQVFGHLHYQTDQFHHLKHDSKAIEFPLSKVLQDKWQSAVDNKMLVFIKLEPLRFCNPRIALHITGIDPSSKIVLIFTEFGKKPSTNKVLLLPLCPQNIEALKIVRYWLKQLFLCVWGIVQFNEYILNPEMVKLLFDDDEISKMKFNCQTVRMTMFNHSMDDLKFTFDYLVINSSLHILTDIGRISEKGKIIIFNILLSEGYRIPEVVFPDGIRINDLTIYNKIINDLETATDLTKLVNKIKFYCEDWSPSEIIVKGIEMNEVNKGKKIYKIKNINDPKMEFSIKWTFNEDENEKIKEIEISKIK
ncbi:F-box domain-containing protein [Meloidogyne graminicola]|uniref:F-box domain-containing protein n=1 Tax=Meloidogyne graminicola TaxID=189291 RepID=A0A8T0A066_9BILA|nr:F-box domain-containing protein [Meloidogyne graminicola]